MEELDCLCFQYNKIPLKYKKDISFKDYIQSYCKSCNIYCGDTKYNRCLRCNNLFCINCKIPENQTCFECF